jgi:hypothetical protein
MSDLTYVALHALRKSLGHVAVEAVVPPPDIAR